MLSCRGGPAVGRRVGILSTLLAMALLAPLRATAVCNAIPGATGVHRGALGTLNRPFASPGDLVGVDVNRALCDKASPGLAATAGEHVVTLLFEPPGGPANAAVLSDDCAALQASGALGACAGSLGGGAVACYDAGSGDLVLVTKRDELFRQPRPRLFFRLPDTSLTGVNGVSFGLAAGHTLSGPATVVVARKGDVLADGSALQCGLAGAGTCAQQLPGTAGQPAPFVACVDRVYELDGSCDRATADVDRTFGHFTALPPPNDYAALEAGGSELLLTTDAEGNAYLPWDYSGVLAEQNGVPVARIGRGGTTGLGLRIPTEGFLTSHAPEGLLLPPVFTPLPEAAPEASLFGTIDARRGVMRLARNSPVLRVCQGGGFDGAACVADADCGGGACADSGVLACQGGGSPSGSACVADADCPSGETCLPTGAAVCVGGTAPGAPCSRDVDCDGGACPLPELFEFRGQAADSGAGPVALAPGQFTVATGTPVPLEGIDETGELFSLVLSESLLGDQNGDGDSGDFIVTLTNRDDGKPQDIGTRSVTRLEAPPFAAPAVAVEDDVIAFFQSEPRDGGQDLNGDGDALDAVVRAFRLDKSGPTPQVVELTPDPSQPGSPPGLPAFASGRAGLVVSRGLLFFGTGESLGTASTTVRVSTTPGGTAPDGFSLAPDVTPDGRFVAYQSVGTDIVPGDANGALSDVFVYDRDPDGNGILDEPGTVTELVSVDENGMVPLDTLGAGLGAEWPSISADGRHVAFQTPLPLVSSDTNGTYDIYVHDRSTNGVVLVSVSSSGAPATANLCFDPGLNQIVPLGSLTPTISATGRFVIFTSFSQGLDPGDGNHACDPNDPEALFSFLGGDVYVHDRDADGNGTFDETTPGARRTVRVSVDASGLESAGGNATANFLFVGRQPDLTQVFERYPLVSDDGRFVAFNSTMSHASGDGDACLDVYLRDRDADGDGVPDEPGVGETHTFLVSARPGAPKPCEESEVSSISRDGRFVAFSSTSSGLVPGDTNGVRDVFVWDRLDGDITRESVSATGAEGNAAATLGVFTGSVFPIVSDDGRIVSFGSHSSNLVPDDVEGGFDFFTRIRPTGAIVRTGAGGSDSSVDAGGAAGPFAASIGLFPLDGLDLNGTSDVGVARTDPLGRDLDGDGDAQDGILQILDLDDPAAPPINLRADSSAVVRGGRAAFLRAEEAPVDLNGDTDSEDLIAQYYPGRDASNVPAAAAIDLGRAADAIDLSSAFVIARVPESAQGAGSLNGDADTLDAVAQVFDTNALVWLTSVADPAIDELAAIEPDPAFAQPFVAAVITPEADEGADRNGDGDTLDRALQLVTAAGGVAGVVPVGEAAEDLVVGASIVAFRTPESQQGADLNGDGDLLDSVLQVYDLRTGVVVSSDSAAVPCRLEVCDPTTPYRVVRDTVRFLTLEAEQGEDLNGDLDTLDLVVQLFNPRAAAGQRVEFVAEVEDPAQTGDEELGIDPLSPPPFEGAGDNSQVLLVEGVCAEDLGTSCAAPADCGAGGFCDLAAVVPTCKRAHATCTTDADCVSDAATVLETCVPVFAAVGAKDTDRDEVPDAVDNCPFTANLDQSDLDADAVGDACDVETCGNDVVEGAEQCDTPPAGLLDDTDGCTRFCRVGGCFGDVNLDGDVDQADADVFAAADGCFPCDGGACNTSCDGNGDGVVNNADALALEAVLGSTCPVPASPPAGGGGASPKRRCGLGAELALALLPLLAWRVRRRRPARP